VSPDRGRKSEIEQKIESQDPLVVGIGNPFAADDGAGIQLVRMLRLRSDIHCRFLEMAHPGPDWLDSIGQASGILFIDAIVSGAEPGALYLIPLPSPMVDSRSNTSLSSHGLGLSETVELGYALGIAMPRLLLLGIELGSVTPGDSQSSTVTKAIESVVANFSDLVELLKNPDSVLWKDPHQYFPAQMRLVPCAKLGNKMQLQN
jgi:hydrogenase maturation protease